MTHEALTPRQAVKSVGVASSRLLGRVHRERAVLAELGRERAVSAVSFQDRTRACSLGRVMSSAYLFAHHFCVAKQ